MADKAWRLISTFLGEFVFKRRASSGFISSRWFGFRWSFSLFMFLFLSCWLSLCVLLLYATLHPEQEYCEPTCFNAIEAKRTCCGVGCFGGFHIQRFSYLFIFLRGDFTWDLERFCYLFPGWLRSFDFLPSLIQFGFLSGYSEGFLEGFSFSFFFHHARVSETTGF